MSLFLLYAAIAVATFGLRAGFMMTGGKSERLDAVRRFVPIAALTALVTMGLFPKSGEPAWGRTGAALLAAAVAYRFKNVALTVVVGLALLFLFKAL